MYKHMVQIAKSPIVFRPSVVDASCKGAIMATVHHFQVTNQQGEKVALGQYRDKVLLIVNTASQCGFTPQYQDLESIYKKYHAKGLEILAFPCNQFGGQEPGSDSEIAQFCELNYGVSFPIMKKVQVNGPEAEPFFEFLKDQARGLLKTRAIKWNFTKFLVNKDGVVVKRYAPRTKPSQFIDAIEAELALLPQNQGR
jgi:glutathione peroxidase